MSSGVCTTTTTTAMTKQLNDGVAKSFKTRYAAHATNDKILGTERHGADTTVPFGGGVPDVFHPCGRLSGSWQTS